MVRFHPALPKLLASKSSVIIAFMEPKREYFVDPRWRGETGAITPPARRLEKVIDCLNRDDISKLSPLETFVVERVIGMFVSHGFIGSPVELETSLIQADPPERMYTNGDPGRENDVSGILHSLEGKGFLVLDPTTEKYSLGTQSPKKPE